LTISTQTKPTSNQPTETEQKEYMKCALSKKYFMITYCKTLDVDAPPGEDKVKLIPDDKSTDEIIDFMKSNDNEMCRKSRQQMASWKCMADELHNVIFMPSDSYSWLNMSILETLVDDGTYQSLMGKAMFIYDNLPDFLKRHLKRQNLMIKNPATRNFIKGCSTTEYSGRSGAYTGALMDEAQDVPFFRAVFASIHFAVKNRLKILFTPPDDEKDEIELMWLDDNNGFVKRRLHWSLFRTREWYEQQCKGLTQDEIDRELDLKSGSGRKARVWQSFDYEKNTRANLYQSNLPIELCGDFGRSDLTRFDFYQKNYDDINIFDEFEGDMDTPHGYIKGLAYKLHEYGAVSKEALKYWDIKGTSPEAEIERAKYLALVRECFNKIRAYGDPTGNNVEQTSGTSVIQQYGYYGLIIETRPKTDYQYGLDQVDLRFKELKMFLDRNKCPKGITEVQKWCYPTNPDGSRKSGEKPLHDIYSHGCAAKRYICENNPLPIPGQRVLTREILSKAKQAPGVFHSRLTRSR
jgi:hypothetical protein